MALRYYQFLRGAGRMALLFSTLDAPDDHLELERFRTAAGIPTRAYRSLGTADEHLVICGVQLHHACTWGAYGPVGARDWEAARVAKEGYPSEPPEVEYESPPPLHSAHL